MANSKVVIEVVATSKGMKILVNDVEAATKATNKLKKSQDGATSAANRFDKQNKSLYQSNLSSAKSFSKMNQTIGGDTGSGALVGSYAILAANVFAVSAAFNAFRHAAQVDKLAQGLEAFSNTTGMSLDLVSQKLQEATGYAVSLEQAMKTAALSTSAGFGVTEMEGLTRVAKGASQALGRDMGDALDRLTRGAIKLEPEILDELGIMVRLDDATERYAAQLGKTASQLTRFERQQAFMNAIITEGEAKFGAIADAIDPNEYDKLAATFADLTKDFLNFLNSGIIPLIGYLLEAKAVFLGLVIVFAGGIVKKMIPALINLTARNIENNLAAKEAIAIAIQQGDASASAARKQIKAYKAAPAAFNKIVDKIQDGTATTKEMTIAQGQLTRTINNLGNQESAAYKKMSKAQKKVVDNLQKQKEAIIGIKNAQGGTAGQKAFDVAQARLKLSEDEAEILEVSSQRTFTYKGALEKNLKVFNMSKVAAAKYGLALRKAAGITKGKTTLTNFHTVALIRVRQAFARGAIMAKVFGKALLSAIPIIGQVILALGFVFDILKRVLKWFGFFSDEAAAAKDKVKELEGVLEDIPNKVKEMADQQKRANNFTATLTNRYKIIGGLSKTVADQTIETVKALEKADMLSKGDQGRGQDNFDAIGAATGDVRFNAVKDLSDQIPEYSAFLKKEFEGLSLEAFVKANTRAEGLENTLIKLYDTLKLGKEVFEGLSAEAEGLGTTFTEAEKDFNKFLQGSIPTTQFDAMSLQIDAMVNSVDALAERARKAGADDIAFVEEQINKMGPSTAMVLGNDVFISYEKFIKLRGDIAADEKKLSEELDVDEKKRIKSRIDRNQFLFDQERRFLANKIVLNVKSTKVTIDELKVFEQLFKARKASDTARMKSAEKIAKNAHTALAARKVQAAMDADQITHLKNQNKLYEAQYEEAEFRQKNGLELSEKQTEVLATVRANLQKINTLENNTLEIKSAQASEYLQQLNTLKEQLVLVKELGDLELENAKLLQAQRVQMERGFGATATGGEKIDLDLQTAQRTFALAVETAQVKFQVIEAEHELLKARVAVDKAANQVIIDSVGADSERGKALKGLNDALDKSVKISSDNVDRSELIMKKTIENSGLVLQNGLQQTLVGMGDLLTSSGGAVGLFNAMKVIFGDALIEGIDTRIAELEDRLNQAGISAAEKAVIGAQIDDLKEKKKEQTDLSNVDKAQQMMAGLGTMMQEMFGEEGAVASAFAFMGSTFLANLDVMSEGFKAFGQEVGDDTEAQKQRFNSMGDALAGVGNIIGSIAQLAAASSKQKIAAVDSEIAAEKKKDGKSKQSLARIAALEKKKEEMERKAFERNKKLQMAQIIVNTASAIMKAAPNFPMMLLIGAMGAAQLAMVAGTSYQGGGSVEQARTPSTIEVGKRDSKVDVSKGATAGETAYLRGQQGVGTSANTFIPGGAAGMKKGYASGGEIMVGERGPEIIQPTAAGYNVVPNDKIGGETNVNFSINAVDAAGVEELLVAQRGNIIGMIREAANEHGEEFMEDVNTGAY